jgi:hypothetical protein
MEGAMAKGRMLQNRISKSNKIASLSSDTVRLLYTWLLSHLDVNGNFYADPTMVNNLVFTRLGHSIKTVSSALDELADKELIVRYQIDGEVYLNYPDFLEKQPRLNPDREGTPDIPNITPSSLLSNSGVTPTQYKIREDKISKDKPMKEGFEDFWKAYPKKVNKKEATSSYNKIKVSLDTLLKAIEKQKKSDQWLKDGGQFIPYPSTWLNQERWNDELTFGGNNGTKSYRDSKNNRELDAGTAEAIERIAENLRSK